MKASYDLVAAALQIKSDIFFQLLGSPICLYHKSKAAIGGLRGVYPT